MRIIVEKNEASEHEAANRLAAIAKGMGVDTVSVTPYRDAFGLQVWSTGDITAENMDDDRADFMTPEQATQFLQHSEKQLISDAGGRGWDTLMELFGDWADENLSDIALKHAVQVMEEIPESASAQFTLLKFEGMDWFYIVPASGHRRSAADLTQEEILNLKKTLGEQLADPVLQVSMRLCSIGSGPKVAPIEDRQLFLLSDYGFERLLEHPRVQVSETIESDPASWRAAETK